MDSKKHIVNLESFRDMLHIFLRVLGQAFDEPPFKDEILAFIRFIRHSVPIRTLTDVNINKLYQPWRSFAAIINKCLTGKSSGYDSLRLSQAQILWGLYHKRNVDYAYLMWEDFVYQVKHKNKKKSNEMYYPRFTKFIIHHFMSKDPSIPRRNKVNWHYVRDDFMFSTIKLAYKEYYAIATGEAAPKPMANARRARSCSNTSITPSTAAARPRLTASAKGKQTAKASKAKSLSALSEVAMTESQQLKLVIKRSMQQMHISQPSGSGADEGTGSIPGVLDVPSDESEEELSWNSTDDEGDDIEEKDVHGDEEDEGNGNDDDDDDEDDDDDDEEVRDDKHESDKETREEEERHVEEEEEDELYKDVNINQGRGLQASLEVKDSHVTLTPVHLDGQQESSSLLRSLEENFSEVMQTNQFAGVVSAIPRIVQQYMDQQMNKAIKVTVQIQSYRLRDEAQRENDEFVRTVDKNIKKIIKEQAKDQFKTVTLKRRRDDDADKDEEPIAGPDRGPRDAEKASASESTLAEEPMQTTSQMEEPSHPEFDTGADDQPIVQSSQHPEWFSQPQKPPTPDRDWNKTLPAVYGSIQLSKQAETRSSFDELMDIPLDFSYFLMNRLRGVSHWGRKRQQFYGFAVHRESARDVYSKKRIIAVTELMIVEWHSYKHLDWITVRRDDDKLYKFKEGGLKRLHIQDIKDMLLLLVQGKLTNLTVEERFAFNVSLRMFTKSIVIQRRVKDLQLGVKSYQKRLNLTKPDTYRDETLIDVHTALDDRLKGIRMRYLPQTIWIKSDKDRAAAMIQAIDNMLKTRRIMRSLEKFVGGRLYERDFRMLQRTI
nr:hypothetical protein [Tanacetum cinerariifolium]